MELDTLYPKKGTIKNEFNVWITWSQGDIPWTEICAMVIEVFGLPGNRFTYHTTDFFICFKFKSEKDQALCEILLSEHIVK